jgi:two-component sensor histidine kinase
MLMLVQLILRRTQAESVSKYRTAAQERVAALARAHALVSESPREAADLRRLVEEILTPHRAGEPRRVRIEGDSFALSPRAAQAVAMSLHELATNAAKYGALSTPEGQVEIGWSSSPGGVFVLTWTETGAPPVAVPTRRGFGSAVIEATVQQLGGTATLLVWRPQGLRCVLRLPADAIKP